MDITKEANCPVCGRTLKPYFADGGWVYWCPKCKVDRGSAIYDFRKKKKAELND